MFIDIVSDVICPWCYLGKKRLERALAARPDLAVEIRWHPWLLAPDVPAGGRDYQAFLAERFGRDPQTAARHAEQEAQIEQLGLELGIDFAFGRIAKVPNTRDAHLLILWAGQAGVQDQVAEALFKTHFELGGDVGDAETLVAIAAGAGMDGAAVRKLLADGADNNLLDRALAMAAQAGITGVPVFIANGKYAMTGTQPVDQFLGLFDAAEKDDPRDTVM